LQVPAASVVIGYNAGADEASALAAEVDGRAVQADVSSAEGAARLVEEQAMSTYSSTTPA